jgi:AsmA protein
VHDVTRALKIPLIVIAVLVGLLVAGALAIKLLFDPNDYRGKAEQWFLDRTGRELSLAGNLELGFWPRLAVRTGPVSIANERGFGKEPLLAVSDASVSLKLWPLLHNEYEIGHIELVAPKGHLAVDTSGRDNWSSVLETLLESDAQPAGAEREPQRKTSVAIAGVHISEGELKYDDRRSGTHVAVRDWSLETGALAAGKPMQIRSSFAIATAPRDAGRPVKIEATLSQPSETTWAARDVQGSVAWAGGDRAKATPVEFNLDEASYDTVKHVLAIPAFAVNIGEAKLKGAANGTLGEPATAVTGTVRLEPTPLKGLMSAFGVEAPATRDSKALGQLAFESKLAYGPRGLGLEGLSGKLDATTFRGFVRRSSGGQGAIAFNLDLDEIDLDRYLPPADKPASKADESGQSDQGALSTLNASGRLAANRIRMSGLDLRKVQADIRLAQGRLRLDPLEARVFGGNAVTRATYDLSRATPSVNLDLRLSGVQIAALSKQFLHDDRLAGTGSFTANLAGRGSGDALMATLAGPFEVNVVEGSYKGVDLWYEIERAITVAQGRSPGARPAAPSTPFDRFAATGRFAGEVIDVQRFDLANAYLTTRGKGKVNYKATTADLKLVARLLRAPEGSVLGLDASHLTEIEIPVTVSGPMGDPKVRPDVGRLLQSAAKQRLGKESDKVEKKLKDKVEDTLKDLLGQ